MHIPNSLACGGSLTTLSFGVQTEPVDDRGRVASSRNVQLVWCRNRARAHMTHGTVLSANHSLDTLLEHAACASKDLARVYARSRIPEW